MISATSPEAPVQRRHLNSPAATEALAAELSLLVRPGLVILLRGDLGAGKSTFARALIRALLPQPQAIDIPSPTFTLAQAYGETRVPVLHADLYRVITASEVDQLGLEDQAADHLLLVEWPERGDWSRYPDVLVVALAGHGDCRVAELEARGGWVKILARNGDIQKFLNRAGWPLRARSFLEGDASSRRYERLVDPPRRAILMDMPTRSDGPPVKDGLPYSAIAHLAEHISAVVAVNGELVARGFSAPRVFASDLAHGLAVIEDLGPNQFGRMIAAGADMREPMRAAIAALAEIARQPWPGSVSLADGRSHAVPPYDMRAQLIEADLLPSWFWPYLHGLAVPQDIRAEFESLWRAVLPLTVAAPPVWTLRDYHSPNLIWIPARSGIARVGLIDTQDSVLGHPAYDLASLLQDARTDIDFQWADELFDHYCGLREGLDREAFTAAYAILGAQRATKILGIFARLSKRDGKSAYLRHMPRVSRYLERNLAHPVLAPLKRWYDRHLPPALREGRR